jgi:hypothetical protein
MLAYFAPCRQLGNLEAEFLRARRRIERSDDDKTSGGSDTECRIFSSGA